MAYERVNWENLPSTKTPINRTNLNKTENGIKNNDINIGGENYDNTKTYEVGDIVRYNEKIYKCITAITTAENFDSSKWEQTNIVEIVQSEKSKIYELIEAISTPIVGEGENITLNDTAEKRFENFDIEGNSVQESTSIADGDEYDSPSPEHEQPIKSAGENGSITEKIVNKNLVEKNLKGYIAQGYMSIDNASESFVFWAEQGKTYNYSCLKSTNRGMCAKSETINIVGGTPLTNIRTVSNPFTSNFTGWCVLYVNSNLDNEIKDSFMIEQGSTATDYIPHEEQTYTIPTQQPMRAIGDIRDTFIKKNNKWYEHHPIVRIESYNGETITSEYISNTGELSTGATVDYISNTPVDIECTEEQSTILFDIEQNAKTYKGVTHIYSNDAVSPNCYVEAAKDLTTLIQ